MLKVHAVQLNFRIMDYEMFTILGAAGNFLCPASQLSYNGMKTGIY